MPRVLKSAKDGKIAAKSFYSVGEIGFLLGMACSTVRRLIDQRAIHGLRLPTKRRQRRVTHKNLIAFVRLHPDFGYMLERLNGYDPNVDPEGAEPPLPPAPSEGQPSPWGPERPRSARRGQVPISNYYSAAEVGFLLGRSRRSVLRMLESRVLMGVKVPARGLSPWTWRISHHALVGYVRRNPCYQFALARIKGYSAGGEQDACPARKEPLLAPGSPGYRGHPHQAKRGGFKPGRKPVSCVDRGPSGEGR